MPYLNSIYLGKRLLPDDTKPSPQAILIYRQLRLVRLLQLKFYWRNILLEIFIQANALKTLSTNWTPFCSDLNVLKLLTMPPYPCAGGPRIVTTGSQ